MNETTNILYKNYDDFDKMPRRGCFCARGLGIQPATLKEYADHDLIEIAGKVYNTQNRRETKVWCMTEKGRKLVRRYTRDDRAAMPCGHTGFQNCPDSEFYQCKECDGRFTRKEVTGENDVIGVSPPSE